MIPFQPNNQAVPDVSYHYTTGSAMQSILSNVTIGDGDASPSIRFTDCQFLNDPQELRYGVTLLKEIKPQFDYLGSMFKTKTFMPHMILTSPKDHST